MILETVFDTKEGSVALIDFMTAATGSSSVVRIVEGRSGHVPMRLDLALRFDYASAVPWVTRLRTTRDCARLPGPMVVLHSGRNCAAKLTRSAGSRRGRAARSRTLSHGSRTLRSGGAACRGGVG
jgi:hypothetical protein